MRAVPEEVSAVLDDFALSIEFGTSWTACDASYVYNVMPDQLGWSLCSILSSVGSRMNNVNR